MVTIIEIMRKPILQENFISSIEAVFLAGEKLFFRFIRYSRKWNSFSQGKLFLTNSSFRLVESNFCLVETVLLYSGAATFLRETLFLLEETDFLASRS